MYNYRGFSIDQERDGSFTTFRLGHFRLRFPTLEEAKEDIDHRLSDTMVALGYRTEYQP